MPIPDRYRAWFDEAPSGIGVLSLEGVWLEVNPAMCEMLGYRHDDLIGRSLESFVHRADLTQGALRARLLGGEPVVHSHKRFVRRDERVIWINLALSLGRDGQGEPAHFIVQLEDITAAKETEQELAREHHWLVESQAAARIGSWEIDLETGVMRWSAEQFKLYGVEPSREPPQLEEMLALIHPDDRGEMLGALRAERVPGESFTNEYRVLHPSLGMRTLLVRGRYLPRDSDAGRPTRIMGTTHDVTAEREAEAERRRDEERLRLLATIVQRSDDAIVVCSTDGLITQWNEGARRLYGYSSGEVIGRTIGFTMATGRDAEAEALVERALAGETVRVQQAERVRKDGGVVTVSLTVGPVVATDGRMLGASAIARDITEQVRAQERLMANERLMDDAQALAHVGSWEWDLAEEAPSWSAELGRIYGHPTGYRPRGEDLTARIHPDDRPAIGRLIEAAREGRPGEAEYRVMLPDGRLRFVHARHRVRVDAADRVTHIYGAVQDITERRRYEAELERLATHDPLTGLPNRRTFDTRLGVEVARATREGMPLSLAVLDLDHFKQINDTLGHQAGDDVLSRVGELFGEQVRSYELIARVGGEEFAWLLPGAGPAAAGAAAERLRAAVAACEFGEVGRVTLSAGVATLADGQDAHALYRRADLALLAAKQGGRDRVRVDGDSGEELRMEVAAA